MKLKPKFFLSALVLAFAGQASAVVTLGNAPGGSSLLLSVWDTARNVSYTRNLGPNLNAFLPSGFTTLPNDGTVVGTAVTGDKTPVGGLSLTFTTDALFTSTFASSTAANINWNIVAFDNQSSAASGLSRAIVTANSAPSTNNAGLLQIGSGGTNYLNALVSTTTIGNAGVFSAVETDPALVSYAGNPNWGDGLNGGNLSSSAIIGSSLDFYYLARTVPSGSGSLAATLQQYGNATQFSKWTLQQDGTALYALSPVPEPSALILLGAGLLGVIGMTRRRLASQKTD